MASFQLVGSLSFAELGAAQPQLVVVVNDVVVAQLIVAYIYILYLVVVNESLYGAPEMLSICGCRWVGVCKVIFMSNKTSVKVELGFGKLVFLQMV